MAIRKQQGTIRVAGVSGWKLANPGVPPQPTNFIGGGTEMTAPDQGPAITTLISNASAGQTVTLSPGIYMLDFRSSGQLMVCILLKSGVDFDFSQAELRLRPGQDTIWKRVNGVPQVGVPSSQWGDIITNQGHSASNPLSNVTIRVGCLNGRAVGQQGTTTAGTAEANDDGARFDGISPRFASNVVIEGGINTPWGRGPIQTDGQPLYRGVIKNIRGWDGGGGDTEAFHYTYDSAVGTAGNPVIARRLEVVVDDGALRSASGGSSNGGDYVLHEDIVSHSTRAQGMTSWRTKFVTYRRINSGFHGGSGMRNEEGYGHVSEDCWTHDNSNQGYNIKGDTNCATVSAPVEVLTATNILITDNNNPSPGGFAVQQNSTLPPGITFSGREGGNRARLSNVSGLCSGRAPAAADLTGLTTVTTWTPPLPE